MADLSAVYTLTTSGGNITFNDGDLGTTDDLYWISEIEGLDGPSIRAQVDNAPQAHGGIVHTFWKGPRHVTMQGSIIIQSVAPGGYCLPERNQMEDDLREALDSILQADGTLSWTPAGLGTVTRTLTVRNDIPVQYSPQESYMVMGFVFGLVSAAADWT
jgi:hypothetical protein